MVDGGLQIEIALRNAVENYKDFERFADIARGVARDLDLDDQTRDKIFGALSKAILNWEK